MRGLMRDAAAIPELPYRGDALGARLRPEAIALYAEAEQLNNRIFDETERRRHRRAAGLRARLRWRNYQPPGVPDSFTCDDYTEAHEARREQQEMYDDEFNKYIGARR